MVTSSPPQAEQTQQAENPSTSQQVHEMDSPQEALSHFQKVNLANQLRMMADNQNCLDQSKRRAKVFLDHEAAMLGQATRFKDDGEDMKIAIDSPETHNHHYHGQPAAPQTPTPASGSVMSPMMKLAAVGLMASGVGIPAGIAAWNLPALLAKPAASSLLQDYDLFVGSPPEKPTNK